MPDAAMLRGQHFHSKAAAIDLSPQAQIRYAAAYLKAKYGNGNARVGWLPALDHEEKHPMNDTTIRAPRNPYRQQRLDGYAELAGMPNAGPFPRRHDGDQGPGMTAADLDRMVRQHFLDGRAAAEREAQKDIDELRGQLADAFDEGYTAGRVERAQGLARDVHARIFEPELKLIEARHAKTKAAVLAKVEEAQEAVLAVREFAASLFGANAPGAEDRAAAQVARDEA